MRIRFGGAAIASNLLPAHVISGPAYPLLHPPPLCRFSRRHGRSCDISGELPPCGYTRFPSPEKEYAQPQVNKGWENASWDFWWGDDDGIALRGASSAPINFRRVEHGSSRFIINISNARGLLEKNVRLKMYGLNNIEELTINEVRLS